MSVIMTLYIQGDPKKLESIVADDPQRLRAIVDAAKEHGVIAHRFYGSGNQILVIDEWPDEQSFEAFFKEQQPQIGPLMEEVGASGEPRYLFWHKLETGDDVGWGAEHTA
jgi:hypothetical protein